MPKLKPSEEELKIRMLRGIIKKYLEVEKMTEEQLAAKMHIAKRTLQNKRRNPESFTYYQIRLILKILRVPDEEKIKVV